MCNYFVPLEEDRAKFESAETGRGSRFYCWLKEFPLSCLFRRLLLDTAADVQLSISCLSVLIALDEILMRSVLDIYVSMLLLLQTFEELEKLQLEVRCTRGGRWRLRNIIENLRECKNQCSPFVIKVLRSRKCLINIRRVIGCD